jgi:hypothetical protein
MSKHTPGPWSIRHAVDGSGDCGIIATRQDGALHHVVVAEVFASIDHEDERSPEVTANSRLIAAAPELLAALEALLPGADAMGWDTSAARAAIAKAKGQA